MCTLWQWTKQQTKTLFCQKIKKETPKQKTKTKKTQQPKKKKKEAHNIVMLVNIFVYFFLFEKVDQSEMWIIKESYTNESLL